MGKFNLDDYETVDSRLKRFWKDHPAACLNTELLTPIDKIDEHVAFKATISFNTSGFEKTVSLSGYSNVTGYAYEKKGDGYINKTSWVENCETSAIGRALANLGYSGDKRASREEMSKVTKISAQDYQERKINNVIDKSEKQALLNKLSNPTPIRLDPETIGLDTIITFGKYEGLTVKAAKDKPTFSTYVSDCLRRNLTSNREDAKYWVKVFKTISDTIGTDQATNELDEALYGAIQRDQ